MTDAKHTLVLDTECYRDYWLAAFKSIERGTVRTFEMYPGRALDRALLHRILTTYRIVTFNGNGYDMPMLALALTGANCERLKQASDEIIVGGVRSWEFYDQHNLVRPDDIDHIDLIEVAFGDGSLKLYGGRLHSRKLQDLPIDPSASISPPERDLLRTYCVNDLDTTIDLFNSLRSQIELRERMTEQYEIDLRSKSDAQIAEAVIRQEVSRVLGHKVVRPTIPPGSSFQYRPPAFLRYKSAAMQLRLAQIAEAQFVIANNGSPEAPEALEGARVAIGSSVYRMGIGGLHSCEESVAHHADETTMLMDADVASYYPAIILQCGLYPKHLSEAFLRVYKGIFDRRIAAKRAGDKTVADTYKIVLNGSFGKFGSPWSTLYSPDLMIQVTVTGQLALLMLIEALEFDGIRVVSANTDGIVMKFPRSRYDDVRGHIAAWERATGFAMEETRYKALYSQSVNAYMALTEDGKIKGKGPFASASLAKNPQNAICVEAVKALLSEGTSVEQTIRECRDIRKFVTVRRVNGGAMYRGQPIGKVVRWYFGAGRTDAIHYVKATKKGTHNRVATSDGAVPLMELPDEFPADVDYGKYIGVAYEILCDIGAL
ncbi:MAG: Burkholderia phage vB BceS [Pseudomonadota bacterium]|jgi:hypothetical protein